MFFFFSSRRRHTRCSRDWSSDVCSSDLLSASLGERITRTGTLHPFFAPVAVFQTRDGYVYVAVGNDAQWAALAKLRAFAGLDRPEWAANAGRIADVGRLHRELGERVARLPTAEAQVLLREAGVPISRVNTLADVVADPLVAPRLVHVPEPPTGLPVALPAPPGRGPPAPTFPPRPGEHNDNIYRRTLRGPPEARPCPPARRR